MSIFSKKESDSKMSWKVLECECVWINVSKSKMKTTFSFVTNAAPDKIERKNRI